MGEQSEMLVEPYFVKLFNKRWYGIVRKPVEDGWMFVLTFDRVLSLELTTEKFRYHKGFGPVGFFRNNYGILWVEDTPTSSSPCGPLRTSTPLSSPEVRSSRL